MLRLPPFEYFAPTTLDETIEILSKYGSEAMLVAGGTDVYPGMKRGLFTTKKLVALNYIAELKTIQQLKNGISIGAGLTLTDLSHHPLINNHYSALAKAASLVATPHIRNMGTIGGNLCVDTRCNYYNQSEFWRESLHYCLKKDGDTCWVAPGGKRCWAINSSDTAPIMVALGAKVRLVGPQGERFIPVQALYHNDGIAYLQKDPTEILVDIHLPDSTAIKMTYLKLKRRGSFDFPILGVAVALKQAEDGTCTSANIVLGAVASYPLKATNAETILIGQKPSINLIEEAAQAAFKPAKPLDNTDMTHPYRKQMTRVYVARALREAAGLTS